jgi:hypothetical protein
MRDGRSGRDRSGRGPLLAGGVRRRTSEMGIRRDVGPVAMIDARGF